MTTDELYWYRHLRGLGYTPARARLAVETDNIPMQYYAPDPAGVAAHRVRTRARMVGGTRDTWRLAYAVARLEARAARP
jgi:hypothetical protein